MIPLSLFNPWVLLGIGGALIASNTATHFLSYASGKDDQIAYQTTADLAQARLDLKTAEELAKKGDEAGRKFEDAKPQIVREVRERTREIVIPPDADPFVPVWFVRMFDRLASGDPTADTYPGQSDSAASRTRLSGTRPVLEGWVSKYETCRAQIVAIGELKPVLPQPPKDERTFLERIF